MSRPLAPTHRRLRATRVIETDIVVNGQHGVVIGAAESFGSTELVIDPAAGQIIEVRQPSNDAEADAYGIELGTTITRCLVDTVPPEVQAIAHHADCTVADGNQFTC